MSFPAASLPERWIHTLWAEMRANYGGRWDRMFPVPPCPPTIDLGTHAQSHIAGIQAVWARRLGRFQANPGSLRHALDHLPEEPPSLPQFEALCNRRPDAQQVLINGPKPDPQRVQEVIASIGYRPTEEDPRDWARRLRDADAKDGTFNGRPITLAQRDMYRRALRAHLTGAEA